MRDAEVASCGLTLRRAGGGRNVKRAEQTGAEQFGCTPLLKRRANEVKSTLKSGMREFAGESLLRLVSNISYSAGASKRRLECEFMGPHSISLRIGIGIGIDMQPSRTRSPRIRGGATRRDGKRPVRSSRHPIAHARAIAIAMGMRRWRWSGDRCLCCECVSARLQH